MGFHCVPSSPQAAVCAQSIVPACLVSVACDKGSWPWRHKGQKKDRNINLSNSQPVNHIFFHLFFNAQTCPHTIAVVVTTRRSNTPCPHAENSGENKGT